MSFAQNKYQVIKKAIPYDLANFVFNYFLLKRDAVNYLYANNLVAENGMLGYLERSTSSKCIFSLCRLCYGNITNESYAYNETTNKS
jgi:hypothetical protein